MILVFVLGLPCFRFSPKVLQIAYMVLVEHGLVGYGLAVAIGDLAACFEERLVAALEEIDLGIEELGIEVPVEGAVLLAQKAEEIGTTLRRELAVKDEHHSLLLLLLLGRDEVVVVLAGWTKERVYDLLLGVDVLGGADVAALVLVRVPGVDDDETIDLRGVGAVQHLTQRLRLDHVQVVVFDARLARQRVVASAVADQTGELGASTISIIVVVALEVERFHDHLVVLFEIQRGLDLTQRELEKGRRGRGVHAHGLMNCFRLLLRRCYDRIVASEHADRCYLLGLLLLLLG